MYFHLLYLSQDDDEASGNNSNDDEELSGTASDDDEPTESISEAKPTTPANKLDEKKSKADGKQPFRAISSAHVSTQRKLHGK